MTAISEEQDFDQADVGAQRIARVYAEALLNAAEKRQQGREVLDELDALEEQVFRRDRHFETFLASGAISRDPKAHAIKRTFEGRTSDVILDFLNVLNKHDRLDLLRPIIGAYREILNERAGRVRVQVRSALPLPEDQQENLRKQLRETFHKDPILEMSIDPDLIGGLVVQVGDWLYDASVKARLDQLRNQILERSSHEIQSGRDRFSSPIGD